VDLKGRIMIAITGQLLRDKLPRCKNPQAWADTLNEILPQFDITTPSRAAAFIAQTGVESAGFSVLEENLYYTTADRLSAVWPTRFPRGANVTGYLRNPEALANFVYARRMGNGDVASGDGYRFRGRGLLQITGRTNYSQVGQQIKLPLQNRPEMLTEPENAALSAAYFWHSHHLNALADSGAGHPDSTDFERMTIIINGGRQALDERRALYEQLSAALGA
jgi:putative chitinase